MAEHWNIHVCARFVLWAHKILHRLDRPRYNFITKLSVIAVWYCLRYLPAGIKHCSGQCVL